MAFNVSSYITNGHRFPFIATLSKPFLKYTLNNVFWSGSLILIYLISSFKFLVYEEGCSIIDTFIFQLGFLIGIGLMITINFVYFTKTNKDLEKVSNGKYTTKPKSNPMLD